MKTHFVQTKLFILTYKIKMFIWFLGDKSSNCRIQQKSYGQPYLKVQPVTFVSEERNYVKNKYSTVVSK